LRDPAKRPNQNYFECEHCETGWASNKDAKCAACKEKTKCVECGNKINRTIRNIGTKRLCSICKKALDRKVEAKYDYMDIR
jgi:hypothetical protein